LRGSGEWIPRVVDLLLPVTEPADTDEFFSGPEVVLPDDRFSLTQTR